MHLCAVCGAKAEMLCQRCREPYCSRQCQAADWPVHKKTCFAMPCLTQERSDVRGQEREKNESYISLRPPKTTLPESETIEMEPRKSLIHNPFKRNSENIAFNSNDIKVKNTTNNKPKSNDVDSAIASVKTLSLEKVNEKPPAVESWMKPFPIDEKGYVTVIVSFVADDKIWVMHEKNATASRNLLREINKGVSSASTPKLNEIQVNSLFRVPFEGIHYRGVVIEPVSAAGTVLVRLIDYGNVITVPIDQLKAAIPVMKNLNAFGFQIKVEGQRKTHVDDKLKIQIETIKDDVMIATVEGSTDIVTLNDIEVVPLLAGKPLFCLDFSNVGKGYISTCVNDTKSIAYIASLSAKVSVYCNRTNGWYSPTQGELCLSKFEDNEWYRVAVTKVIDSNTFEIMFIDYGNIATASSKDLREMPQEFTHHRLMNKCYIKDFPEKPTNDEIIKMETFFDEHPVFEVLTLEAKDDGAYVIELKRED